MTGRPTSTSVPETRVPALDELVLRASTGDPSAASALYTRYYSMVFGLHLHATDGDVHLAADLTQDTFAKALYRLDRFEWRGEGSLASWIVTIARNTHRDHLRSATQRHHGGYRLPERADPDVASDPEAVAERDVPGVKAIVAWVLAALTPDHRLVLGRMIGEGRTAAEVARELGRSEAAVHQLKRRALLAARRSASRGHPSASPSLRGGGEGCGRSRARPRRPGRAGVGPRE